MGIFKKNRNDSFAEIIFDDMPESKTVLPQTEPAADEPLVVKAEGSAAKAEETIVKSEEPLVKAEETAVKTEKPIEGAEEALVKAEKPISKDVEAIVKAEKPIIKPEEPQTKISFEAKRESLFQESSVRESGSALEMLKQRMGFAERKTAPFQIEQEPAPESKAPQTSLLEKLKPYTTDDEGHDLADETKPLYELQSVADILKTNGERVLDSLSKKYDVSFDDLGKGNAKEKAPVQEKAPVREKAVPTEKSAEKQRRTDKFVEMVNASLADNVKEAEPTESEGLPLPDISDIDTLVTPKTDELRTSQDDGTTIMFTPVKTADDKTDRISISTATAKIDLGDALDLKPDENDYIHEEPALEKSKFESYEPLDEFTDEKSGKRLLRMLAINKRSAFLRTAVSFLSAAGLCLFFIPALNDLLIKSPRPTMSVCLALLCISLIANLEIFTAPIKAARGKATSDLPAMTAALSVLLLAVYALLVKASAFEAVLLCAVILFFRALSSFWELSSMYGNLKQTANSKAKKAVSLIDDNAVTYAMAKSSIEGDVLAAAPRSAEFVNGFMKYSTFNVKLQGKIPAITVVSSVVALLSGIALGTRDGALAGISFAAMVLCITALPTLFFIDALPLFSSAKRLNKKGAMIAGISGAKKIELANAAVLSTEDIFPFGTVTLQGMQVLSKNSIDDTILKAASLTEAVHSPLCLIFKKIAGTSSAYSLPDSDTVKYENTLGISGWVDNELLFIGNRSLMTAHQINVPDIEVDKQILRKGYFPIYLATEGRACALLAVQYDVDPAVSQELRRITQTGVTLLVENSDPNITEEMLCDYIGLYEGTVKLMSKSGSHMYKTALKNDVSSPAPAAFRSGNLTFISILNCASRIKKSNLLLTLCYALLAVFGVVLFVYYTFSAASYTFGAKDVLLYELCATVLSILIYLIKKP